MISTEARDDVPVDRVFQDAIAAYSAGKLDDAEARCRDLLKRQPNHIGGLQVLAAIAGRAGAPRRGIELVQNAIAIEPKNPNAHIQLAKLLRQERRTGEAIAALKTAIELEPDSAAAYNDLGLIYLESDAAEALNCFGRAIELKPDLVIAYYNTGLALERQGRVAEAMAAFRRLLEVDSDFAEAHAKLGNLLLMTDHDPEGLKHLRCCVAAKPDSSLAFMCEAKILVEEGNAAAAEPAIRRAIELDRQNPDAQALLGSILMELGRFEDAAAASDLAVALNRRQLAAYHALTHVKKMTEADRPLVNQMEWMLKEYKLAAEGRIPIHFALGKAYDDLGEYGNAIAHFDEANALKRQSVSCGHSGYGVITDRQIEKFSADFFSRNAGAGSDWDGAVLVVGMPRSGTTLVEQILSSHPHIAAAGELAFWRDQVSTARFDENGRIDPAWISATARQYQALLSGISPTARRVTDKMPQNFNLIALIHAVLPRARIIHCRRHPVDTCLSNYFQNFSRRIDFAYDRSDLLAFYRQYERLMAHWRSVLPTDIFMEVQYEDLVANPEPVTRKMIEFCGLDWDDACLHSERNKRAVRTASVWQARQPVYRTSVARWRNYEPWLGPLRELLPDTDRTKSTTID